MKDSYKATYYMACVLLISFVVGVLAWAFFPLIVG